MRGTAGLLVFALAFAMPMAALAKPKTPDGRTLTTVNCDSGSTISAALQSIDKAGPNTVLVSGTCHENISIVGFDDLKVLGQPATLMPVSATGPWTHTLAVGSSRLITIDGFSIEKGGSGYAVWAYSSHGITLSNDTFMGNVEITGQGDMTLTGCRVIGATAFAWGSTALGIINTTIDGQSTAYPSTWMGLMVGDYSTAYCGDGCVIKGYAVGVALAGTAPTIQFGDPGSVAEPGTIRDNYYAGVTMEGCAHGVVNLGRGRILHNGSQWAGGGIQVKQGGQAIIGTQGDVSSNTGPGIRSSGKGMVILSGGTVSNNTSGGIVALNDSMVVGPTSGGTATVEGNAAPGFDLSCDASSMIINAAGITGTGQTVNCPNVKPGE
jgi:hypothetical protein